MDDEEERYELTDKGIALILNIDTLFKNTSLSLDEIAVLVGLDSAQDVSLLYALGEHAGVLGD